MSKCKRFKPRYSLDVKGKRVITADRIITFLKVVVNDGLVIYRSWTDPRTGYYTKPVKYKISLSKAEEGEKPLVVFYVPDKDIRKGEPDKWKVRGTVAQSSFEAGRDCIGCEGVRYTRAKHSEVEKKLLLNSPKAKKNPLLSIFIEAFLK